MQQALYGPAPRAHLPLQDQKGVLAPGSPARKAIASKRSVVFTSVESVGKSLIVEAVAAEIGAPLLGDEALTRSKALTEVRGPIAISMPLERLTKARQAALVNYIDTRGPVYGESRGVEKLDPALLARLVVVPLGHLAQDDVEAIIVSAAPHVTWEADTLAQLAVAVGTNGRLAVQVGEHFADQKSVTVEDVEGYLRTVLVTGSARVQDSLPNGAYISAWIKAMRLGDEPQAMYWLSVLQEKGVELPYLGERIFIFAVDDAWSPDAFTVGMGVWQCLRVRRMEWTAVTWGTSYMCRVTKWWETEDGRRANKIRYDAHMKRRKQIDAGIAVDPLPSYALDRHTGYGKSQAIKGIDIDERFSGAMTGRLHMAAMFVHHGSLDPSIFCPECIEASEFLGEKAVGVPLQFRAEYAKEPNVHSLSGRKAVAAPRRASASRITRQT